jgi:Holliday junction resolvase RusA-like endonuclease
VVIEAFFSIPVSWSRKRRSLALGGELRPTVTPDWNNLGGVTDACNGVVWADDRQIVNGIVVKRYSDMPRMVITVTPINGADYG